MNRWMNRHLNLSLLAVIIVCSFLAYLTWVGLALSFLLTLVASTWYLGRKNRSIGWYIFWCWVAPGFTFVNGYGSMLPQAIPAMAIFLLPLKNKVAEKNQAHDTKDTGSSLGLTST